MNVISQLDNLPLSYSQKPSFCFNISSPFAPAGRTIKYYRSIGFHPNQRRKSGACGLLQGEALLWLGNDLWDGGSITKSHEHLPASACTESWHSDERCQGGTNKSVLPIHSSNVVYPCGLQRVCVCVCLSTPFRHIKLLTASSWIWCKNVCSKVRQCRWVCVLYFTCFSSERAAADDNAKTTSLFPVRACTERSVTPPT